MTCPFHDLQRSLHEAMKNYCFLSSGDVTAGASEAGVRVAEEQPDVLGAGAPGVASEAPGRRRAEQASERTRRQQRRRPRCRRRCCYACTAAAQRHAGQEEGGGRREEAAGHQSRQRLRGQEQSEAESAQGGQDHAGNGKESKKR